MLNIINPSCSSFNIPFLIKTVVKSSTVQVITDKKENEHKSYKCNIWS